MNMPEYLTINGTNYATAKLTEAARSQVANLQIVDAEIARLQQSLAIAQTARNAYAAALIEAVKSKSDAVSTEAVEDKPKKARSPRKSAKTAE